MIKTKEQNIFVDMDGVLAVYDENIVEYMYNENYFATRPAVEPMLELVRRLCELGYNVYILTSCIDSEFCIPEKTEWLNNHLPEVPVENRIFVEYGQVKAKVASERANVKGAVNVLIDDYTENLDKWKDENIEGALPVKVLNGINGTKGTWLRSGGEIIDAYSSVSFNVKKIHNLIRQKIKK